MRLIMTTDTVGGVWTYATVLSAFLSEAGIDVILAVIGPSITRIQRTAVPGLEKKGVVIRYYQGKLEWMDDAEADVVEERQWFAGLVKEFQPDILHFNNYGQVDVDADIPKVLVAHSCVASWWRAVKRTPLPSRYDFYVELVTNAFRVADVVVSPTWAIRDMYQQLYSDHPNHIVVPNGIPLKPRIQNIRRKLLFSAGRLWDEGKNIELLTAASKNIDTEIFIAGEKEPSIPEYKNVTFLGELTREQVSNWMRIATAYVMPVKYEPFGLSFLEAASRGTPLIGGEIETLREIWGDAMIYVDPEDKDALAAACNSLIENAEMRTRYGNKAFNRSQDFSVEKMGNGYKKVYESLLTLSGST